MGPALPDPTAFLESAVQQKYLQIMANLGVKIHKGQILGSGPLLATILDQRHGFQAYSHDAGVQS